MDTSILSTLFQIAPDLMEEVELRSLVLERVAALEPIGRRALASRLHLMEREVRSAADALKEAGCIVQNASGMELTERGRSLVEAARSVSRGRRSLSSLELTLSRRLGVERVCVVHGDADCESGIALEAARALAGQIRFLTQGAQVLGVSGGPVMAMAAREISPAAPMEITVVPAHGGNGGSMRTQANAVAEAFAEGLGGECRMLHLPEGLSAAAMEEVSRLPQVRETLELLRHADVLLYEVQTAMDSMGEGVREVAAQALGFRFAAEGKIVGGRSSALSAQDLGTHSKAAAIAVGARSAEAIITVCMHHPHRLLVTDEGAAQRIAELLRAT